jgi:simple sugar transport system ATP-binding protein
VKSIGGEDFEDVSFSVRAGEIIGLCGATSSGRLGVAEAVAGLGPYDSGAIRINGAPLRANDVPSALALGVGCVPKSRHRQGLVLTQSIADNVTMPIAKALGALGFIAPARRVVAANEAIATLGVVTQGPDQLVSDPSGGNQQKVMMGRALSSRPSVLVLIDPTAGVDVKSKEALLRVIENTRRDRRAILVASGELEDLRVCDRVLVMRHGKVAEHAAGWSDNESRCVGRGDLN